MSWSAGSSARCSADGWRRAPWPAVLLVASCALAIASPAGAQRLVLLPLENLGEVPEAVAWLTPRVEDEIRARGWELVSGEWVERSLAASRVRRMDSLPAGTREALLGEFDAQAYVATTIFSFRSGAVPVITLGMRVVDAGGAEQFGEVIGLSTEDTRGPLDEWPSDEIGPLVDRVMKRLFQGFPRAGERVRRPAPANSPVKLHPPFVFLSADLDAMVPPRRVTVLPFRSFSEEREAARIAAQLAARWLDRAPGFEQVDPADLRQALVAERVRDAAMSPETMAAVGRRLGSNLFLQGTVYRWKKEADTGSEVRPPEIDLNLTLIDASTSRIVWSSQHQRRGDQYRGFLRLGSITNVVALADRVIGEMVAAQVSARPVSVPPARSPLVPPVRALTKGTKDP